MRAVADLSTSVVGEAEMNDANKFGTVALTVAVTELMLNNPGPIPPGPLSHAGF
jgi:hypothetical protein